MNRDELVSEICGRLVHRKYNRPWGMDKGRGRVNGFVLSYLLEHGGKALSGEICQAMGGSTPHVAAILRELEAQEMITRAAVEHDRRKVCVTLTEKGARKARARQQRLEQKIQRILDELTEEEANALPHILDVLEKIQTEHEREHPGKHGPSEI